MKKLFVAFLIFIVAAGAYAQHGLYAGGDISMLPEYEKHSSGYLDGNGKKIDDLLLWFKNECGWNTFRVRLFVNPSDPNHEGVVQDLNYVKALGKRIKDAGCKFMLDFHYSDTWVDATHIQAPASWNDCTTAAQKAERLGSYTRETLKALKDAGAEPDLVQVGNEIMYGIVGVKVHPYDSAGDDWDGYHAVMKAGCDAVRATCPTAKIIIHTDRPCESASMKYFYDKLADVDYDIIGLSYYPFWHGELGSLRFALNALESYFPTKKVHIVETAYNFQWWPTSGVKYDTRPTWPCSADGQYKFVKDLVAELGNHNNVEGLMYWFPEEAGCGDGANWTTYEGVVIKSWLNRGLWWEDETTTGHWPVKASEGMTHYLLKNFLSPEATGISSITSINNKNTFIFNINGQRVKPSTKGLVLIGGRKTIKH